MEEIESKISFYADNIAKEICDMPSFEVDKLTILIKTRMLFSIRELYTFGLSPLNDQRKILSAEYQDPKTPNWRKSQLQGELASNKEKVKLSNRIIHTFREEDHYIALKNYLKEKGNQDLLNEFYNTLKD